MDEVGILNPQFTFGQVFTGWTCLFTKATAPDRWSCSYSTYAVNVSMTISFG